MQTYNNEVHAFKRNPNAQPREATLPAILDTIVTGLRVRLSDGTEIWFKGRDAWALNELHRAGLDGCTPITHVGQRWSSYVLKLRQAGIEVETIHEQHGGPYRGHHARYVLRSPIEIVEKQFADQQVAA